MTISAYLHKPIRAFAGYSAPTSVTATAWVEFIDANGNIVTLFLPLEVAEDVAKAFNVGMAKEAVA